MSVIFIVLPLAILMAMIAVGAFLWAVHRGQFDDLEVPAYQVLFEEADQPGRDDVPPSSGEDPHLQERRE
jgi:cbb3-type cytochrome oxidase maturation protein